MVHQRVATEEKPVKKALLSTLVLALALCWSSLALAATLVMGLTLGGALARTFYPMAPANGDGAEMAALEDFQDFPEGSLGAVLASYHPEEGNGL